MCEKTVYFLSRPLLVCSLDPIVILFIYYIISYNVVPAFMMHFSVH